MTVLSLGFTPAALTEYIGCGLEKKGPDAGSVLPNPSAWLMRYTTILPRASWFWMLWSNVTTNDRSF